MPDGCYVVVIRIIMIIIQPQINRSFVECFVLKKFCSFVLAARLSRSCAAAQQPINPILTRGIAKSEFLPYNNYNMIELLTTKRTDPQLLHKMQQHYSQPKGFVGRNICYAILWNGVYYGHIVGGSATRYLPGRHERLSTDFSQLGHIVNNIFYSISPVEGKYPFRNFTSAVIAVWREHISYDWYKKYGDVVLGFETLVELPRTGECYRRDGWELVGQTKGYTCKRVAGKGSDNWTGKRVWDTVNLRPKLVYVYQ